MLAISTAHTTPEVCGLLDQNEIQGLISYKKEEYGFFIYVPSDEEETANLPECLSTILNYARIHDASWIMLDRDVEINSDLPLYDWY
ncbi:hypothetical protein BK126_26105 [Paenibacillus sp. FSL H7-0326]|nr:hypothetical protein BK126_26105 [Paenibacillus sp. FSL H7-0326]